MTIDDPTTPVTGNERSESSRRHARTAVDADAPSRDAPLTRARRFPRPRTQRPRIGTVGRLAAFHALVIASVLGIVVFQFTDAFSNRYRASIMSGLTQNVNSFTRAAAHRPRAESLAVFIRSFLADQSSGSGNDTVIALTASHLILGTPGSSTLTQSRTVAGLLNHPPAVSEFSTVTVSGASEMVLAVPIVAGGRRVGTFLTTGSLADLESTRTHMFYLALAEGLILLLAAFVSISLLLSRLLGSVRRLTQTAADIGLRGELGTRLEVEQGGDEVGAMAATFNAMIDKIDSAVSLQRQMMSDVSHQLRSPITVVRGHLDVMGRGSLDDPSETRETIATVIDELDRMNRLVERLLLLGRSLEADFTDVQPVDVRALLLDLASASEMLAPRQWAVGPIPDVVVYADLDKLRSALLNLVENAVQATRDGDSIRLSARVTDAGASNTLEIMVDDSGPGIAPGNRDAVLRRFASSTTSESGGTGLGLAIVGAVARSHGGDVRIDDSPLGGCRVTISLPLPAPGSAYPGDDEGL